MISTLGLVFFVSLADLIQLLNFRLGVRDIFNTRLHHHRTRSSTQPAATAAAAIAVTRIIGL